MEGVEGVEVEMEWWMGVRDDRVLGLGGEDWRYGGVRGGGGGG